VEMIVIAYKLKKIEINVLLLFLFQGSLVIELIVAIILLYKKKYLTKLFSQETV
jgi:hypothetical protein